MIAYALNANQNVLARRSGPLKCKSLADYQHHFLPLDPPPGTAEECEALICLGSFEYHTQLGAVLTVRFLGTGFGVRVIAVTLPQSAADDPKRELWFKQILETSLSAIRLSYDTAAQPVYTGDSFLNLMQETDGPEPEYRFPMGLSENKDWKIDIDSIIGVFGAIRGPIKADVATLLAESQVPSMPPHYAVLSLIRAIELIWHDEATRRRILNEYEDQFSELGISQRRFQNALPELRNRCAHGRGRGHQEPFVGIGYNSPGLRPLRHLLAAIVARGLREVLGIQTMPPQVPPAQVG